MATKPGTTFQLATNVNYDTGPFNGSATKLPASDVANGFIPGEEILAENHNYYLHWAGEWITNWVDLGTSAPDEDAHIVETDAEGASQIAQVVIGGLSGATAHGGHNLLVQGDDHDAAVRITGGATQSSLEVSGGAAAPTALVEHTFGGTALSVESLLDGRALEVAGNPTSPQFAAMRLHPQDDDPTTQANGDLLYNGTTEEFRATTTAGAWRSLWASPLGHHRAYNDARVQQNTTSDTPVAVTGASITLPRSGIVMVRAVAEIGHDNVQNMRVRLFDATNLVEILARTILCQFGSGAATERDIVLEEQYAIPSSGLTNIQLQFDRGAAGVGTAYIRNASILIEST